MMNRNKLKVLLLQIRHDEITKQEEYDEFVKFTELSPLQIDCINAYDERQFTPDVIDGYDALFIGGSSDATVLDPVTYNFMDSCRQLVRHCYEHNIPTLASCFGFQLAVIELGGEIIVDKPNMEMGLYEIELTQQAQHDPLLHDYPNKFWAVSGHKERATILPQEAIHLGGSELCPFHIFTFENKPFYGFQFHPEVDTADLITRITRYQHRYLNDAESLQLIIDKAIHPTALSNALMKHFVDRVLLPHHNKSI